MIEFENGQDSQVRVRYEFGRDYLKTWLYLKEDQTGTLVVGLGEQAAWGHIPCKEAFGKTVQVLMQADIASCTLEVDFVLEGLGVRGLFDLAEGWYGGSYDFPKYKHCAKRPAPMAYLHAERWTAEADTALAQGKAVARQILFARDLVNEPANRLTPALFAERWQEAARSLPVEVEVLEPSRLAELNMAALLAVGNSSANPARLIVLRYHGAPESREVLGYIGKGATVDSGGYCLKPADSMSGIKGDMAGAAAVGGALLALAENGIKANVTAVIPSCENRISNDSLLPGDVIESMSGLTIEVKNTDAEGRLILADAITYAIRREGVSKLVNLGTLTGGVCAMFGFSCAGAVSNDDPFYETFSRASDVTGERYWRLPTYPEYEKLVDSKIADIKNLPGSCSTIAAALFLKRFVEGRPWIHLDIAGTAWTVPPVWAFQAEGATGASVTTLYQLAKATFKGE